MVNLKGAFFQREDRDKGIHFLRTYSFYVRKLLLRILGKKTREKCLTGLKISLGGPAVSHLLFADDSLFFCKANVAECDVILKLLKDYEAVSGQLINFDKSSLQFGHKVPDSQKVKIQNKLGITKLGGMGNYLGIPESLGGSKIQGIGFLNERVNNKVNSWTVRFLIKGDKEVMINSVASIMSNHVMSCYILPKAVIKKITGVIAHFW